MMAMAHSGTPAIGVQARPRAWSTGRPGGRRPQIRSGRSGSGRRRRRGRCRARPPPPARPWPGRAWSGWSPPRSRTPGPLRHRPSSWVSTKARRRSRSSVSSTSLTMTRSLAVSRWARAGRTRRSSSRRRLAARTESVATCRAMPSTHVRALASARNRGRARQARRKTSWVRSSATSAPAICAHRARTSPWVARRNPASAWRSPPRAASASLVISSNTSGTSRPPPCSARRAP